MTFISQYGWVALIVIVVILVVSRMGRSCRRDGCGHEQFGNDGKCAICRLPL